MGDHLFHRLGSFFLLVGCGFLILFIGSVLAKETTISFLLFAAATMFLGYLLHNAAPRAEQTRFSGIRKASQRSRQRREEKQAQKDQKK
jgi:hypothetical protein